MGNRTGSADLPLHGGKVPRWLADRMAKLGRIIIEALILEFGRDEVLRRLAHPFWFQSLGCVMGMDWHSSGITTSVVGALKRGLRPVQDELGLYVCGGRGKHSLKTPGELVSLACRTGLEGDTLARTSKLVAKVDSAAVQDGFQLYLHAFVVAADGKWTVVQQGMDPAQKLARRYHWLSEGITSFVEDPHNAIEGRQRDGHVRNLADARAGACREASLDVVHSGPDHAVDAILDVRPRPARAQVDLFERPRPDAPQNHLVMPFHHDVRPKDVQERRLHAALAAAAEAECETFEELMLVPGVGPRTLESLAMVSEIIYGAPSRFTDPARYSLAHGGKDGAPFPVPLAVYDATLDVMRNAVSAAKLGNEDKLSAIKRLDEQSRRVEPVVSGPGVAAYIEHNKRMSPHYRGRTVFGWARELQEEPATAALLEERQGDLRGLVRLGEHRDAGLHEDLGARE